MDLEKQYDSQKSYHRHTSLQADEGSNGFQIMQLSLFMMLLAFFIVLNATASIDEGKMKPVIQSLYKAFASKLVQRNEAPSRMLSPANYLGEGEALQYIEELFDSEIPGIEIADTFGKGYLSATFDRENFEAMIGSKYETTFDKLIAALIFYKGKGKPHSMNIVIPFMYDREDGLQQGELRVMVSRMERYVKMLIDRGMAEELLSVSFSPENKADEVQVLLQPYNPQLLNNSRKLKGR